MNLISSHSDSGLTWSQVWAGAPSKVPKFPIRIFKGEEDSWRKVIISIILLRFVTWKSSVTKVSSMALSTFGKQWKELASSLDKELCGIFSEMWDLESGIRTSTLILPDVNGKGKSDSDPLKLDLTSLCWPTRVHKNSILTAKWCHKRKQRTLTDPLAEMS